MGGNKQKKSFGFFNISKTTKPRRGDDFGAKDANVKAYKVYPSDEDRGRWIAEPGIDRKASAYIATIQQNWNRSAASSY